MSPSSDSDEPTTIEHVFEGEVEIGDDPYRPPPDEEPYIKVGGEDVIKAVDQTDRWHTFQVDAPVLVIIEPLTDDRTGYAERGERARVTYGYSISERTPISKDTFYLRNGNDNRVDDVVERLESYEGEEIRLRVQTEREADLDTLRTYTRYNI